jgi:hypothetical protein
MLAQSGRRGRLERRSACCQEHELILRMLRADARFGLCGNAASVYRVHDGESVSRKEPMRATPARMELTDRAAEYPESAGRISTARPCSLRRPAGVGPERLRFGPRFRRTALCQGVLPWKLVGELLASHSPALSARLRRAEDVARWTRKRRLMKSRDLAAVCRD